jgi:hypothetical protein
MVSTLSVFSLQLAPNLIVKLNGTCSPFKKRRYIGPRYGWKFFHAFCSLFLLRSFHQIEHQFFLLFVPGSLLNGRIKDSFPVLNC